MIDYPDLFYEFILTQYTLRTNNTFKSPNFHTNADNKIPEHRACYNYNIMSRGICMNIYKFSIFNLKIKNTF